MGPVKEIFSSNLLVEDWFHWTLYREKGLSKIQCDLYMQ